MCGGFNVEVLENFCKNEALDTIDDDTTDDSIETVSYRDETTVSDEEDLYRDDSIDSDGDPYRESETVSYRDETTVADVRNAYRNETTVLDQIDLYLAEATISHVGVTYQDETTVLREGDRCRVKRNVPDENVLNPKIESPDNETPKKKRPFSILDISEYFSDSNETDMSQYGPILFLRRETTNDVTSSESSSDSEELEDVYGHIVFRRKERKKPNEKLELLKIDPKSLPYRISNRVKKQSKFLTEDNIDKDILDENLERLRGIILKSREAKLKKAEFSKHIVKESEDVINEIFYNGTCKKEYRISNVQLKPCSVVLERHNISSIVISHNSDSKIISQIERKRHKNQIVKLSEISKKLRKNVFVAKKVRYCTRSKIQTRSTVDM